MAAEYQRLTRAAPQPFVPLQEAGLSALGPLLKAVTKLPPAKSAPILSAVSTTISGIAPLRLFSDFSPAHAPPEVPLLVTEGQVSADSVRSGSSYTVMQAFADTSPITKKNSTNYWCSKQRPSNSKSSITVTFLQPEQLTGLYIALPEQKLHSEFVGFEALQAPEEVKSVTEITEFVHSAKAKWTTLGVIPAQNVASGVRLPISASRAVALRISFKGFAKVNTDKYHGLANAIIYVASNKLRRGVGGTTLYTESAEVLDALSSWLTECGRAKGAEGSDSQYSALKALSGLSLASGSLGSTLALLQTLLEHPATLPDEVAHSLREFVELVDDKFNSVGAKCNADTGVAMPSNPDRTDEAKFTDKSSNVEIQDGDTAHCVRSSSSPEYAAINLGISKGRMVWEMKITEDSRDGECQCFGICKKPVGSYSYDSTSDMWLWRAYNGQLYDRGSSTTQKSKFHQDDTVRFELDMDVGELRAWVNGAEQGVLFSGLSGQGWTIYPCVQFYSSSRACSLEKLYIYDGSTGSGAGGSGSFLSSLKEVEDETVCNGLLGKGAFLSADSTTPSDDTTGAGSGDKAKMPMTVRGGVAVRHGVALPLHSTAGSAHVAYQLGAPKDEKRKKEAVPSPFDTFEALVGIADWVATAASSAAVSSSGSAPAESIDEDSKVETSAVVESKEDVGADGGVAESKEDSAAAASGAATTITFSVQADGVTLWTSPAISVPASGLNAAITAQLPVYHCLVKLPAHQKLELHVESSGKSENVHAVWGDARISISPWLHERNAFEREMDETLGTALPDGVIAAEGQEKRRVPTSVTASQLVSSGLKQIIPDKKVVFTNRLLQADVNFTGPVAAAALLRVLRLFAREAYKPVRVTKPAPGFGEPSLPLEIPFVVQADGKVLRMFGDLLKRLLALLPADRNPHSLVAEMISALMLILKGNLRRVVASKVLPADIGIMAKSDKSAGTLDALLQAVNEMMADAKKVVPEELAAAAGGVLDTGLQLFYPTAVAQAAFLADLLGKGEGGVLEVQFAWPTLLSNTDKAAAAAMAELGPGPLTALHDGTDPRFERAILQLQAYATRKGFAHTTVAHFGKFIHFLVSLPDTQEEPIVHTLSTELGQLFNSAGLKGWSFPQGLSMPEIPFKIERFLEFNRRERLATDPGVAWLRLYPRRVGSFEQVQAQITRFLDSYKTAETATATEQTPTGASPTVETVRTDVFGDAVGAAGADDSDRHSTASSRSRSSSASGSGHDDGDDDDEDGGDDDDDDHDDDEEEHDDDEGSESETSDGGLF